jgi:RimJ/RimL family protein N-acetyltransferase
MPIASDSSTLHEMGIPAIDPPIQAVSDVVLRDGSTMRFRPPQLEDATALLEFFRSLSDQSLYLRFHGHPVVDERLVEPVLEPDWLEHGALVGMAGDRIASLANYVRLRDARTAEVAFAVADELHGRGIATRMLERLAALANRFGIEEFLAEVMPDNSSMLHVFAEAGFETSRGTEGGTTEVRLRLEPTDVLVSRTDERDHIAVAASLEPFFAPRVDRRRALSQHSSRGLRRRRVPGESLGRIGCRSSCVRVGSRDRGPGRSRRRLSTG